jgi:hypothetical protein
MCAMAQNKPQHQKAPNFSELRKGEVHAIVKARIWPVQTAQETPKGSALPWGYYGEGKTSRSVRGSALQRRLGCLPLVEATL